MRRVLLAVLFLSGCPWVSQQTLDELGDQDGDGFVDERVAEEEGNADCAPFDASIHPDVEPTAEHVGDGVDQDCDGVDECFADRDGDGFGAQVVPGVSVGDDACGATGLSTVGGDCDDEADHVFPSAEVPTEYVANGYDDDCDGVDECFEDQDGDGFGSAIVPATSEGCTASGESSEGGDCDDGDATLSPGLERYPDCDGDGFTGPVQSTCSESPCVGGGAPDGGWATSASSPEDCDDEDPLFDPTRTFYPDCDGDGDATSAGTEACSGQSLETTDCPVWTVTPGTDCDNDDPNSFTGQLWYFDCDGDDAWVDHGVACSAEEIVAALDPCGDGQVPADVVNVDPGTDEDCDDLDAEEFPGQLWVPDCDGDGAFDLSGKVFCSAEAAVAGGCADKEIPDGGWSHTDGDDCDDGDPDELPGQVWYWDCDGDGEPGNATTTVSCTQQGNGEVSTICDGSQPYNGLGSLTWTDCDDEDLSVQVPSWYPDCDDDGYAGLTAVGSCTEAEADALSPCTDGGVPDGGWASVSGDDCEDENAARNPGVPLDVPSGYATISDAVAASCDGETISLANGSYTEDVTVPGRVIIEGNGSTWEGSSLPLSVVGQVELRDLTMPASFTAVHVGTQATLIADGVVFSGGTNLIDARDGDNTVTLTNSELTQTGARVVAGGAGTDVTLDGCDVHDNGDLGLSVDGLVEVLTGGSLVVRNTLFQDNESKEAIVRKAGGMLEIDACTFERNQVDAQLYAVVFHGAGGSLGTIAIDDSHFEDNIGTAFRSSTVLSYDSVFLGGTSVHRTQSIGGDAAVMLYCNGEALDGLIDGLELVGNDGWGMKVFDCPIDIFHLTSVANQSGGVFVDQARANINESIIVGEGVGVEVDDPSVQFSHRLEDVVMFDNGTDTVGASFAGSGAQATDPQFVTYHSTLPVEQLDLHLRAGSPAQDAGTGTDLDGSVSDLGAHGGPSPVDFDYYTDDDSDGLPDGWEARYGVSSAGADDDGDGVNNEDEYGQGTDPTLPDTDGDGDDDQADAAPLDSTVQ